jgi:hypothetical protein
LHTCCWIAKNCSVDIPSKSVFNLKSNLTLFEVTHFHPLFVKPSAHLSQLVGSSKQVAHDSWHFMHWDDSLDPDNVYPGLHCTQKNSSLQFAHPSVVHATHAPAGER